MERELERQLLEYNRIYKEMDDLYHEEALKLGLSDSALEILYTICQIGNGCMQRDVCRMSFTRKQTVHSSLRKLERRGYLTTRPGKGREVRIFLTAEGEKLAEERIRPLLRKEQAALGALTAQEREEMLRLGKKYLQLLQKQLSQ